MTEERSMNVFLRQVLPAVFPDRAEDVDWLLIGHNGKTDLERSIPRKIRAWREPNIRFLIARDNDGADCELVKARLEELVQGPPTRPYRIRIVCQELESWLLGDPAAVVAAYPGAERHPSFRSWTSKDPDTLTNASELLSHLTGTAAKVARAEAIAEHVNPAVSRSRSFRVFLDGLGGLLT